MAPIVPAPELANVTVPALAVVGKLVPSESFAWTVMVHVALPSAAMLAGEQTLIVVLAADATVDTVRVAVLVAAPAVAVIVDEPLATAVATPLLAPIVAVA